MWIWDRDIARQHHCGDTDDSVDQFSAALIFLCRKFLKKFLLELLIMWLAQCNAVMSVIGN